jgi:hypothetical protein
LNTLACTLIQGCAAALYCCFVLQKKYEDNYEDKYGKYEKKYDDK